MFSWIDYSLVYSTTSPPSSFPPNRKWSTGTICMSMCTYVYVCTCTYTVFRSFHRNLLVDMFAFIILWSSLGQIYDFVYRINKNYTIIVARRWKENLFRIIEQTANICYWSSEKRCMLGLTLLIMFMSVADMLASCWRRWSAFTPVWAHSFYTPECHSLLCVSERRVSTHTKPLWKG